MTQVALTEAAVAACSPAYPGTTSMPPANVRTWIGFGLMCVALFMSVLDVQIVLTALPHDPGPGCISAKAG